MISVINIISKFVSIIRIRISIISVSRNVLLRTWESQQMCFCSFWQLFLLVSIENPKDLEGLAQVMVGSLGRVEGGGPSTLV